mmetsp:Transcript_3336/g.7877  ORF Transcript_3336/g.7877 Transcript_3336/m.7877 type:complete len:385 (+) Transcript_3336:1630-2784(+)
MALDAGGPAPRCVRRGAEVAARARHAAAAHGRVGRGEGLPVLEEGADCSVGHNALRRGASQRARQRQPGLQEAAEVLAEAGCTEVVAAGHEGDAFVEGREADLALEVVERRPLLGVVAAGRDPADLGGGQGHRGQLRGPPPAGGAGQEAAETIPRAAHLGLQGVAQVEDEELFGQRRHAEDQADAVAVLERHPLVLRVDPVPVDVGAVAGPVRKVDQRPEAVRLVDLHDAVDARDPPVRNLDEPTFRRGRREPRLGHPWRALSQVAPPPMHLVALVGLPATADDDDLVLEDDIGEDAAARLEPSVGGPPRGGPRLPARRLRLQARRPQRREVHLAGRQAHGRQVPADIDLHVDVLHCGGVEDDLLNANNHQVGGNFRIVLRYRS